MSPALAGNKLFVGETVRLAVRVADPDHGLPVDAATATVSVWGPGADRKTTAPVIKDRAMTSRPNERDFVTYLDTSTGSWPSGRYTYGVRVVTSDSAAGDLVSIEYSTFQLDA